MVMLIPVTVFRGIILNMIGVNINLTIILTGFGFSVTLSFQ